MKPNHLWVSLLLAASTSTALPALGAQALAAPVASARDGAIEVVYRDPAKLTEIQRYPGERTDWLASLGEYIAKRAAKVLPPGERLSVTITDVQLAGMFEPWRRGNLGNVRIVRESTPPLIDLSFKLETAQGETLKQGDRSLRDPFFLTRSSRYSGEPLGYEKVLIDRWLAREVRPAR